MTSYNFISIQNKNKKKTPSANEQILFFVYCAVKWKKKFVGRINMFLAVVVEKSTHLSNSISK